MLNNLIKEQNDKIFSHREQQQPFHHPNCVFNALTTASGYDSDSSYVIKKKEGIRGNISCCKLRFE